MKTYIQFIVIFLTNQMFCQSIDHKLDSIFKINHSIEGYLKYFDEKIKPVYKVIDKKDSIKLKYIENKINKTYIVTGLNKSYKTIFNEKEIDDIYKFYTSSTGKKLFNSFNKLDTIIERQFFDELKEIYLISENINPSSSKVYKINKKFYTEKTDGIYSLKQFEFETKQTETYIDDIYEDSPTIFVSDFKNVKKTFDFFGRPAIEIELKDSSKIKFQELTRKSITKTIAIVINKKLISEPKVLDEIKTGILYISGDYNESEINELIEYLNKK